MAYTFNDFTEDVLADADKPLTYQEVWEDGVAKGLAKKLRTTGKTPWATVGARLFVEIRDNPKTRFVKIGSRPARFFLKERNSELPKDILQKLDKLEQKHEVKKSSFTERQLHPLLTYFAYTNPTFSRGRGILTKTIFHEKSSKKGGYNEWMHPDLVGFYLPLEVPTRLTTLDS